MIGHTLSDVNISGVVKRNIRGPGGSRIILLNVSGSEHDMNNKAGVATVATPNVRIVIVKRVFDALKDVQKLLLKGSSIYIQGRAYGKKVLYQGRPFYTAEIRAETVRPGSVRDNNFSIGGRLVSLDPRSSGAMMAFIRASKLKETEINTDGNMIQFNSPIVPIKINRQEIARHVAKIEDIDVQSSLFAWQKHYLETEESAPIAEHFYITNEQLELFKAFKKDRKNPPFDLRKAFEHYLINKYRIASIAQLKFMSFIHAEPNQDIFCKGYITSTRRMMNEDTYYSSELQSNRVEKVKY